MRMPRRGAAGGAGRDTPPIDLPALTAMPEPAAAGAITPELIALNRMGFGPRPAQSPLVANPAGFAGDVARIAALGGLDAYIDQQLSPDSIDDSFCDQKLADARMRISYGAAANNSYTARSELLPLGYLPLSVTSPLPAPASYMAPGLTLWSLRDFGIPMDFSERMRPWQEVRAAALLRAIYSERQLKEVLVDFWHNHFNVAPASDSTISAAFPEYDRIMRQHCLGNFRTFLEAITTSTAMMFYLDNFANRAGGGEAGNENYARELFELHTMGSDNYLKFYDDRSQVGTVTYGGETFERGYIDKDVYEAADCFTGWTVRNGDWRLPAGEPNNGTFFYYNNWHASGAKVVLNTIIDFGPGPVDWQKDGRKVLDLVARHVGTARFVCRKLCRRLIADNPPADAVEAAVAVWMANRDAPDQLRQVVRAILRSAAFTSVWGQKVKRPFEGLVGYMRATGAIPPNDSDTFPSNSPIGNLFSRLGDTGHKLFEWPTPTGYPDLQSYWLSTNTMLRRWNLPYSLARIGQFDVNATLDLLAQSPMSQSCTQIVDFWIGRLFGYAVSSTTRDALIAYMAQGGSPSSPPALLSGESSLKDRLETMVWLMAMSPEYQLR